MPELIDDHAFLPCWFRVYIAEGIGSLCICPYGPRRCHIKSCGKKVSEHARITEFRNRNVIRQVTEEDILEYEK